MKNRIELMVVYKRRDRWPGEIDRPSTSGNARIYYRSRKRWADEDEFTVGLSKFGGETYVVLKFGHMRIGARAVCNPKDRFCYHWGRGLAAYRLLPLLSSPWLQDAANFEEIRDKLEKWANECPAELRGD